MVSNLIGFYAAASGKKADDLINNLCKPISTKGALEIWDRDGAVGDNKNKSWSPVIHLCQSCSQECAKEPCAFPAFFNTIQPAKMARDFDDFMKGNGDFFEQKSPL